MKTILILFLSLSSFCSMAQVPQQKFTGWSPLMDSMGVEVTVKKDAIEMFLVAITEENAILDDNMRTEIDSWLATKNAATKKDCGVLVVKSEWKNHQDTYENEKEQGRKNSGKGKWILPD